jgi:hypothetical protein
MNYFVIFLKSSSFKLLSIPPLLRDHASYAAARMGCVVVVAGNEMDVYMENGLAGGGVDVDPNVVSVRVVVVVQFLFGLVY